MILVLIFDPILKIASEEKIEPNTLVFIDNSKSISEFGSNSDTSKLKSFTELYGELFPPNTLIYKFGNVQSTLKNDSEIELNDKSTSFEDATNRIADYNDVSSILLITDGIFNDGPNPEKTLVDLNIPVYSIGIGDTTTYSDVSVEQISTNKVMYVDRETEVEVIIKNSGLSSSSSVIQLFQDNELLESRNFELSSTGINRENFKYKAKNVGQARLRIDVLPINDEKNLLNNSKSAFVNVLETEKKITVISGSPSRDLAAFLNGLSKFEEYEVNKIVEISGTKFYNNESDFSLIEESDILFFIGFPSKNSSSLLLDAVRSALQTNNKPYLFALNNSTDFSKLKSFEGLIPFSIIRESVRPFSSQVSTNPISNIIGNSNVNRKSWEELPPIDILGSAITPNKNSEIILSDKISNQPVVFSNEYSSKRSIIIAASNIWRWKLQAPNKDLQLFDNFILNSAKWLSITNGNKRFFVEPNKKVFKLGEPSTFSASIYDETFEPISDAKIKLELKNGTEIINSNFTAKGNGQYNIDLTLLNPGEWSYRAYFDDSIGNFEPIIGKLQIEPMELELIERKMNQELLKSISEKTNAGYSNLDGIINTIEQLNNQYENKIYYKNADKELRLSNIEIILIIIVLLFSIEWIVRKWLRMM